jgi:hypothetical protein
LFIGPAFADQFAIFNIPFFGAVDGPVADVFAVEDGGLLFGNNQMVNKATITIA